MVDQRSMYVVHRTSMEALTLGGISQQKGFTFQQVSNWACICIPATAGMFVNLSIPPICTHYISNLSKW
jgi:hypothetical protein